MTSAQKLFRIYDKFLKKTRARKIFRFYPFTSLNKYFLSSLKSDFTEIEGNKMILSPFFRDLSIHGVWEPLETELVKKLVKKGDIVLDIGANLGYYTLLLAKIVGKDGKVFAFEPDPKNFDLLKKNVELNDYENVELIQKAVSNENGKAGLFLSEKNPGDHRIYDSGDNRKFIQIETIRLDDFFKDFRSKVDFIKMDIQGAEAKAIEGMPELLEGNKNLKIITEFWPYGLIKFGSKPESFPKLLSKNNFKPFQINENDKKLEQINVDELLKKYSSKIGEDTNLIWVKDVNTIKKISKK